MTVLDWGIVVFILALALWGYQQGLIVGAITLLGFGLGAFLGSRVGPWLLNQGSQSPYAPLCAAIGAMLIGSLIAVTMEAFALGLRSKVIRGQAMHVADGAGGAMLIAVAALSLTWVFGAVALHAPGTTELRGDVQRSLILRSLNGVMPPSGPILKALNRVDPAPSVNGPSTAVRRPNLAVGLVPDVRAAGSSVFKVLGTACGLGVEGSGWMAAPELIVTNAHVVAGEDDTSVVTQGGASVGATPVYYDPRNDLAVLAVGLEAPVLPLVADPQSGASAAVLGYPENGPLTISPARFGETTEVISEDAYGRGPLKRRISSLRGDVRSGNSGGPVVDTRGRVLATIFAATTSGPKGGFAIPNDVVHRALRQSRSGPVDTGPCTG